MNEITVKIRYIIKPELENKLPVYATTGAAGADLQAHIERDRVIKPREIVAIPTGISIELPGPDIVALIFGRSGLAAKAGISMANGVGVIDSDYRGEISVLLINHGKEEFAVHPGDRIAQMVLMPIFQARFIVANQLSDSDRGEGGFGSTGIR